MHKKSMEMCRMCEEAFEAHMQSLESYLNTVQGAIDEQWTSYSEKFDEDSNGLSDEAIDDLVERNYDEIALLRDTLPQINSQAQLLNVYSFMEHQLMRLCDGIRAANRLEIFASDLNGGGLHASRRYLEKVAHLQLQDNEVWKRIQIYNKLRNIIAHYNGFLSANYIHYRKVRKFIAVNPELIEFRPYKDSSRSSGVLIVKPKFVEQLVDDVKVYFEEIFECWSSAASWA